MRIYVELHRNGPFLIEADLVRGLQLYAVYIDLHRVSGLSRCRRGSCPYGLLMGSLAPFALRRQQRTVTLSARPRLDGSTLQVDTVSRAWAPENYQWRDHVPACLITTAAPPSLAEPVFAGPCTPASESSHTRGRVR